MGVAPFNNNHYTRNTPPRTHCGDNPLGLKQWPRQGRNHQNFRIPKTRRPTILVTVYTKPHCPHCTATKNHLASKDIDYTEAPITEDILNFAKRRNINQAPIVTVYRTGDTIEAATAWGGYNPEKINQLTKEN